MGRTIYLTPEEEAAQTRRARTFASLYEGWQEEYEESHDRSFGGNIDFSVWPFNPDAPPPSVAEECMQVSKPEPTRDDQDLLSATNRSRNGSYIVHVIDLAPYEPPEEVYGFILGQSATFPYPDQYYEVDTSRFFEGMDWLERSRRWLKRSLTPSLPPARPKYGVRGAEERTTARASSSSTTRRRFKRSGSRKSGRR